MTIAYDKGRFIARSIFDENEILKLKGFKWDGPAKRWFTEDYRVAEKLLDKCDNSAIFQIKFMKEDMQKAVNQSASAESKTGLKLYHPKTVSPYPYQAAGVEYILPRSGVLLADQMGLGKTGQALMVMNMRHPVEALIVCPSVLKYNWLKEARKWMIGQITVYIYESKKIRYYQGRITNHDKNTILHIINYDILGKFKDRLMGIPFNFFIADESQMIKNQDANRTKIAQELAKKAKWKIFITGTPIYNKPKDLFVCLNLIDPAMFSNFYAFATRYCGARKVTVAGKSVMKYEGATNMEELNTILRSNYMVRRMAKDVLKDLPEKIKDVIILNEGDLDVLVEKEKKAVQDSKKEEERLKAEAEELRDLASKNKEFEQLYKDKVKALREIKFKNFGELSRIRKEIAVKKAPYVIDFVKDILDNNEDPQSKIVIFGHHKEVLHKIYNELKKYNPVMITGEVSDGERQRAIMMFKEKNSTRVFVGSMGAAGTGVDGLQENCNTAVFAELDWTPSLVDQAESRLQRIGQKNTVWVYHIVANDSIDSRIVKLMMDKEAVSKEILDYRPEQIYEAMVSGIKL
jgi:SWI/SNF-related matrix-associated actin-dependent regulator 1 of chromatin subfamily A